MRLVLVDSRQVDSRQLADSDSRQLVGLRDVNRLKVFDGLQVGEELSGDDEVGLAGAAQARSEAALYLDERSGLRPIPVFSGYASTSAGWGTEPCPIGEVRA
jgi:hypothetical protein